MTPQKPIHLPWNQYDRYWICLWPLAGTLAQSVVNQLTTLGFQKRTADRDYFVCVTGRTWNDVWQKMLPHLAGGLEVEAAIIASDSEPDDKQITFSHKSLDAISLIAENLWLGDAILNNHVMSYKQPVLTAKDRPPVGYESFARVKASDGKIIAGGPIIEAARALGIEYALDRYLHVMAIKTYVQASLQGFLFINFFPGFIQRPEVYLEGLSEAVRMHGVISKNIVLDFTEIETQQDLPHLAKVTKYCREKGYAIALDDVSSAATASKLIPEVRPDFVKLDRSLSTHCQRSGDIATLTDIVNKAHGAGALVIAEGIETEEAYSALKAIQVDMFQGYFFSPPVAV